MHKHTKTMAQTAYTEYDNNLNGLRWFRMVHTNLAITFYSSIFSFAPVRLVHLLNAKIFHNKITFVAFRSAQRVFRAIFEWLKSKWKKTKKIVFFILFSFFWPSGSTTYRMPTIKSHQMIFFFFFFAFSVRSRKLKNWIQNQLKMCNCSKCFSSSNS